MKEEPISALILFGIVLTAVFRGVLQIPGLNINKKEFARVEAAQQKIQNYATERTAIKRAINKIEFHGIIAAQMAYAEEQILEVVKKYNGHFQDRLKKEIPECRDIPRHPDVVTHKLIMSEANSRIRRMVLYSCRRNGFTSMDDTKYNEYTKGKAEKVSDIINEVFDESYRADYAVIDPETLLEWRVDVMKPKMADFIRDMFIELRAISETKEAEIARLEKRLKDFDLKTAQCFGEIVKNGGAK